MTNHQGAEEREAFEKLQRDFRAHTSTHLDNLSDVAAEYYSYAIAFQSFAQCWESATPPKPMVVEPVFQKRVDAWMQACFGVEIAADKTERNHRFIEEALELVQSLGCTASECHQLVDYVFGRPIGEPHQELGGVMVTLAALASANDMSIISNGDIELARVWTMVEKIRAKQAAKPKHSPLPVTPASLDNGWRSIDSAPKDGTKILGYSPYYDTGTIKWQKSQSGFGGFWDVSTRFAHTNAITHWKPLPLPPSEANHE